MKNSCATFIKSWYPVLRQAKTTSGFRPMNPSPTAATCHATRRSVLAWTGASLATALTAAWPGAARAALAPADSGKFSLFPTGPTPPDTNLSRERFLPLLGSEFQFQPVSGDSQVTSPIRARLAEVSPHQLTRTEQPLRFVSFSLLFSCPRTPAEGGILRLQHPALPELELFLSPVGKTATDGSGLLEAICSQRVTNNSSSNPAV